MSCILRISGEYLDVDKWMKKLSVKPYDVYKKGQPMFKMSPDGKINETCGISFSASDADFDDLKEQIKESIIFLTENKITLKKLISDKQVDRATLDFGINLRIGDEIAVQSDSFPPELLKLAGGLEIGITLTIY